MDPMAAMEQACAQAVSLGPVLGTTVFLCLAQWALLTDSCGQFAKAWSWQSRSLKNGLKADGANTPAYCCFTYSRQINRKFIADYFETNSLCSQPGVIFQTRRNRKVCADPKETWVQEYIADLKQNA
ncbi:C-C motif chemokine 3 [Microtus ochrogaster]|uniref:C-C motif chemokine n=1 Tax=Microtus ochrogaster TaxID=79684 RepID=A0A8J6G973_MICOH|nr:C-C motif chemokine 3 [Microtus ochrogaster]